MLKYILLALLLTNCAVAQTLVVEERLKFLALGDSYTIGASVLENERWPVQLVNRIRSEKYLVCDDPRIIATTGWRTDQLKSAILAANIEPNKYNFISLLIGVNNQYQSKPVSSYAIEFEELLNMAIAMVGGDKSRVFVISIPDYGYTPFGKSTQEKISLELDAFNAVNKSIAEKLAVSYFYITDISRRGLTETDLVASDGLHPSGKMYAEWVNLILNDKRVTFLKSTVTDVKKKREEASLLVSPNPFSDLLRLETNPPQNGIFHLINGVGEITFSEKHAGETTVDTTSLASGLYYYRLEDKEGIVGAGKILKN
jgi:lysophospholipase L1-like esterase